MRFVLNNKSVPRSVVTGALLAVAGGVGIGVAPAQAHFQELIPTPAIVTPDTASGGKVDLALTFTHPFEGGPVMSMGQPQAFGVTVDGTTTDLLDSLVETPIEGQVAYTASHNVAGPGDYIYHVTPAPYWEPAEGVMIVHHTKVVVDAFGADEGWDAVVGLPVEILPLTRPYGLYAGNLFRGVVTKAGDPVPGATVEVEWRNDGTVTAPTDVHITQVVKADANGVFAFAMPRSGWWGFAALLEAEETMANPDGEQVPVEEGALIWVHTDAMD